MCKEDYNQYNFDIIDNIKELLIKSIDNKEYDIEIIEEVEEEKEEEVLEEVILDLNIKIMKNKKIIKDLQHKNKLLQIKKRQKIYLKKEKDDKEIIDELLDNF